MDNLTRDLLRNWGLGDYVGAFCAGKIDAGTLRLLSNDEIAQLIPVPGDRARFKANLANWKKEINHLNTDYSLNATENAPTLSVSDLIEGDTSLTSFLALGPLEETVEVPPSFISLPSNQRSLTPLAPASSSTSLDRPKPVPSSSQLLPGDRTSTPIQASPQQSDYVLQTLKSTHDGKAILNQGQKTGKLDDTQRNLLVKLLVSPLFEKDPNIVISNNQLLSWALEIQTIFPAESPALFYTPYVSALVRNTARNASGKLLRYVYNKRRQLRDKGIIEGSSRSRSSSTSSQTATKTQSAVAHLKENTDFEEVEEQLVFLKNSLEPWRLVEEYWADTANYRLTNNYSQLGTLQEYFNEYPVLKQPAGYNLLLRDFEKLYPDKSDALFINIATVQMKVIELARKKVANIRDKELKQTIERYLSAVTETASSDVYNNACLLLLPFLTSSVPLKDKKKTWKPSKTEVRDGFITQIGASADLETTIARRISKLHRFGKSLQPFIVFVGTSISDILECYVVAGNTYYKFHKLLTAVDVCFKIIHATGAKYQDESFVIWMIIQKGFYRVHTEHDKELTTVNGLLVDLGIK